MYAVDSITNGAEVYRSITIKANCHRHWQIRIWGEENLFKDRPFPTKETQETDYSRSGLKYLKSQETDNQSELRRNKGLVRARSFQP